MARAEAFVREGLGEAEEEEGDLSPWARPGARVFRPRVDSVAARGETSALFVKQRIW